MRILCGLNKSLVAFLLLFIVSALKDDILCHFCTYNVVASEARFVSECPLYEFIEDNLPSLFENAY